MKHPFKRTVCSCPDCVACCKRQPGPLVPEDVETLEGVGFKLDEVLVQSKGGLYGRRDGNGVMQTVNVPTITPKMVNGRCIFLDARDRCRIHPIAPFGCAYFDTHMPREISDPRSLYMATLQIQADYQLIRLTLPKKEE